MLPTLLVPLYVEGEVYNLLQPSHRNWDAVAHLLVIGENLVISVDVMDLVAVGWVIVPSHITDINDHFISTQLLKKKKEKEKR